MQMLPRNHLPISSHPQADQEHALQKVAEEVEKVIQELKDGTGTQGGGKPHVKPDRPSGPLTGTGPNQPSPQKPPVKQRPPIWIHLLILLITRTWGWVIIGTVVLASGVLWGTSSPTHPYTESPRVSDGYYYTTAINKSDVYIYPKDMSAFFVARHDDFPNLTGLINTYPHMLIYFAARSDTISVNDVIGADNGERRITQAHVIEKLELNDSNKNPLATYTARDYNPDGYYESRWWPIAVGLIVAGLLTATLSVFIGLKRRRGTRLASSA
jgi:hypothetical protein